MESVAARDEDYDACDDEEKAEQTHENRDHSSRCFVHIWKLAPKHPVRQNRER